MTDEERFETLLARYRGATPLPDFRAVQQEPRAPQRWPYAVAAAIVIAIGIGVLVPRPRTLRDGEIVQTNRFAAHIKAPSIGTIDVAPHTTLQLVQSAPDRYLLDLREGSIHATTTSPPGVFVVNTPKASAIDLGCEYSLSVQPSGIGTLHVTAGWVELTFGFTQSLVPANAHATIDAEGNLGPAIFDDAPFSDDAPLDTILRTARKKDAYTLLNLFPRAANADERVRIYDRLNALVPAPPGITREIVRDQWTIDTTGPWWSAVRQASGVTAIKKKKRLSS
jgi:hypothetical protein